MNHRKLGRWRIGAAIVVPAAVVAGTVGAAAGAVGAAASPHAHSTAGAIQVCASGHGSSTHARTFVVRGHNYSRTQTLQVRANATVCGHEMKVPKGTYHVSQRAATDLRVLNIKVSPTKTVKTRNVPAGNATLRIDAKRHARVTFVNQEAKHTTTPPPVITTPTPTPTPTDPSSSGYIEVCKQAGDSFVNGHVTVAIAAGSVSTSQVVPVGQCTAPIEVPAGTATVTETAPFPYYLSAVTTQPTADLVSANLAGSSATVTVAPSDDASQETLVNLVNSTQLGQFKVCKTLTSNSGDMIAAGQNTFTFTPSYQLAGSSQWSEMTPVTVTVPELSRAACTLDPKALPIGTAVQITEDGIPNTTLTGVSVLPSAQDAGSSAAASTAALTLGPNASGITTASFTNMADGTVEICKAIDDSKWAHSPSRELMSGPSDGRSPYDGTPFAFRVNGGSAITVKAGSCSGPLSVPAGTATVEELSTASFSLEGYTAVGPTGKTRVIGDATANPVTIKVPWSGLSYQGVGNETLVTATNEVNLGQVKVCKVLDGPPVGKTFKFHTTFDLGRYTYGEWTSLTPTGQGAGGEVCGWLSKPLPVIDPKGDPVQFTTTEDCSPFPMDENGNPTVEPTSIQYGGNGSLIASKVFQAGDTGAQDGTYYGTASLGQGVNVMTFTNSFVIDP